ncbi:MAG: zinc-ribbon domain-containing protein [Dysgonomonas sp.]|jgi:transcription elongation factor Elf1|nr:zinc ribbon domain-containing protein [Prevotella sp.]MDR3056886.1 zinc ribbon domain-containing protein [Prevotella sp.]
MIFIFGTRTTTGNPIQTGQTCPACGEEHSIMMVPEQRYFHLFWIPLFPTSKQFTPVCNLCGAMFTTQKVPVTDEVRKQYKTPKWTLLGPIVLGLLILAVIISVSVTSVSENSDLKAKVENPQEGDIYHVKYDVHQYSLMRVASFSPDSVYFHLSPGRIERKSDLDKMAEMDAFNTLELKGFSKDELKKNSIPEIEILRIRR